MSEIRYIGKELHVFQYASNWKQYYGSFIKPYLRGRVLEIGAGIGATTVQLCTGHHEIWLCLEPDPDLFEELKNKIDSQKLPVCCKAKKGTLSDINPADKFDTILYIDVIEHIKDDQQELIQSMKYLNPNGHLIILVPAHQFLFNKFDKAIGHYRRYNKKMLSSLIPGKLQLEKIRYLDSIGFIGSIANKYFLKQEHYSARQINFWDKIIIPISKGIDRAINFNFGKTLVGVWKNSKN